MKLRIGMAVSILVSAVALFAGCKSVETRSIILHNAAGRHDLAIEVGHEALAKNPNDADAHFAIGVAYSSVDSVALAYEHFVKAKEINPKMEQLADDNIQSNYAKHYNRALNLMRDPDRSLAAREFEVAVRADPRQARGYFMLGRAYANIGETDPTYFEKAIAPLDRVLELATPADKHYIDALSLAGQVLARAGRAKEAESRFSRLVEEDPTNYQVIEAIGYDLLDEKDWSGAAVFLELAQRARAKIGAENFEIFYNLGVAYFQMRKSDSAALEKSIENYEKALDIESNEPQTILNIVKAYFSGKNWPQAAIWGERYVAVKSDDETGWRFLARIYTELGDKEKARMCSTRFEELIRQKSGQ